MKRPAPVPNVDVHAIVRAIAGDPSASRALALSVIGELARALGAVDQPYSTRKGHEPAEYIGRPKVWKRDAPTIPGAKKIGRWYSVPRDAYAAWIGTKSAAPVTPTLAKVDDDDTWTPDAALSHLRVVGGGRHD